MFAWLQGRMGYTRTGNGMDQRGWQDLACSPMLAFPSEGQHHQHHYGQHPSNATINYPPGPSMYHHHHHHHNNTGNNVLLQNVSLCAPPPPPPPPPSTAIDMGGSHAATSSSSSSLSHYHHHSSSIGKLPVVSHHPLQYSTLHESIYVICLKTTCYAPVTVTNSLNVSTIHSCKHSLCIMSSPNRVLINGITSYLVISVYLSTCSITKAYRA